MKFGTRHARRVQVVALALGLVGWTTPADAHVTQIVITRTESPTFQGDSFGDTGPYEKLLGRAMGEIDPRDPRNAVITDIALAPRNARGMVEYATDIYILRPVDPSRGNRKVLFELNNRGNIMSFGLLNDATTGGNDPTTSADAGIGFLMRQGYTIVQSGWDATVMAGGGRQTISVPLARHPDGTSIVGLALEEFVIDSATTLTAPLSYAAATLDTARAELTVRVHYEDPPVAIPSASWGYVNDRTIRLLPTGTAFQQGTLYELTYQAKDPLVVGLGFAAVRDVAFSLRGSGALAVYSFCVSGSCRFLHDFVKFGFNEDEQGGTAFDGMLNWLGGASGSFFNYRFAQPGRTHRQHVGRWYPEREFPFANRILVDPNTAKVDGRLLRCRITNTCPHIFEVNSSNDYWVKGASLLHTDTFGFDIGDARNVRTYLLSSLPHIAQAGPGICQQPRNPLVPNRVLRALLVALDEWVSERKPPPASRMPRRADGTLVQPQRRSKVGFPDIPGVTFNGLSTTGDLFDYGPFFEDGILTTLPPLFAGSPYRTLVPRTDRDGNDDAGIRLPEVAVPLATYTGWGLRAAAFAGDDLCDAFGQRIDFLPTIAARLAANDPRPSIEERYPTHSHYVHAVTAAARHLQKQGLLLEEDVQRYIDAADASAVGRH